MALRQAAVIFIPGFYAMSKDYYLTNYLALGLTTRLESKHIEMERDDVKIAGQTGKRFKFELPTGEQKTVDIYEAYWSDLVSKLSERNIKDQIFRGIALFIYWLFSKVWLIPKRSRIMFVQFITMMFLVVLWYYGNVAVALVTIGQNPTSIGVQIPAEWSQAMVSLGKSLGGWPVWAGASIALSFLPTSITSLVDLVDFTTRYMQDETTAGVGGIRDRIRQRVTTTLQDVLREDSYEQVTILAHSFGVTVAIDLLADYQGKTTKPLQFISMGGAVEFLSYKSQWMMEEATRCLTNPVVVSWHDYYSQQDWLCTKTPIPASENSEKFQSTRIQLRVPLAQQLSGESHTAYFFERSLLEALLGD